MILGTFRLARPPVVDALVEAIADRNEEVRIEAARALGRLGAAARPSLPALIEAFRKGSPVLRWSSAKALLAIQAAVQTATMTAGEVDARTRGECLDQALAWLRGELQQLTELARQRRDPAFLRATLSRLKHAPALAAVRPGEGLAQIPEQKWQAWKSFWADLDRTYWGAAEATGAAAPKGPGKGGQKK